MRNKSIVIGTIFTLLILSLLRQKSENMAGSLTAVSNEAVLNIASLYNSDLAQLTNINATGDIQGVNIKASGSLTGANLTTTGNIQGADINATGSLTGATLTTIGNIQGKNIVSTGNLRTSGSFFPRILILNIY